MRFSGVFARGKDTLVVYSFTFRRLIRDTRRAPAGDEMARLPLTDTPWPSCTSILDSPVGAALHLAQRLNLGVVAKSDPSGSAASRERGWRHLPLISWRNNI